MKTDVLMVSSKEDQIDKALVQVDKVAAYKRLSEKNALQLRLLAEEMMGMVRAITGETEGSFWIEDKDGEYQLHLLVQTLLNSEEKEQLLSATSTGKNESARGLMGRLKDLFDWKSYEAVNGIANPLFLPEVFEDASSPTLDWEWSMTRYENALANRVEQADPEAVEAWDELEKSVVKHVADDVKVAIRNGNVEMIILKKFV